MVPIPILTRTSAGTEQTAPKTVLAFLGTALAIIASATVALTIGLATADHLVLAGASLAGGFVVFVGLLIWVVMTVQRDPTRLVVGPITGREFLDYQRWTAGDSVSGEHIEPRRALGPADVPLAIIDQPQLPGSEEKEEEEE